MVHHSLGALQKWSCLDRELPPVSQIKSLHIYDFDNTLFKSPMPNQKLWTGPTVGFLQTQDCFANGGWWHDHHILEATGEGLQKEEPKAWNGWWNEQIVSLVQLSLRQRDALTVLLTGRAEANFASIIKKMAASRWLEFDMICLKPLVGPNNQRFSNTMIFKQALLEDILYTYKDAFELKIYEDRPRHVKGFRDFFERFNRGILDFPTRSNRKAITSEVIHVPDVATNLDPVAETAEVQRMINTHNATVQNDPRADRLQIKRTVFFTGYLIQASDTQNLLTLLDMPKNLPDSEMKYLANNILITPRPAPQSVLDKVGGMGAKQIWQVNGTGVYDGKVFAARVTPIPPSAAYYTENPAAIIVLACRKGAKPIDACRIQNWQPVANEKQFVFETTVGEKVQLRVEKEIQGESEYDALFGNGKSMVNGTGKRKFAGDDGDERREVRGANDELRPPRNGYRGGNQNRGRGGGNGGGRGGQHNARGGRRDGRDHRDRDNRDARNGGGRGRGRGGYKSLDDMGDGSRYPQRPYDGHDDGGYDAAFPAIGRANRGGAGGSAGLDDAGGLKY